MERNNSKGVFCPEGEISFIAILSIEIKALPLTARPVYTGKFCRIVQPLSDRYITDTKLILRSLRLSSLNGFFFCNWNLFADIYTRGGKNRVILLLIRYVNKVT